MVENTYDKRIDTPTDKPESLFARIINMSSREGDLVAGFFCNSGNTVAVAENVDRK